MTDKKKVHTEVVAENEHAKAVEILPTKEEVTQQTAQPEQLPIMPNTPPVKPPVYTHIGGVAGIYVKGPDA